MMDGADFPASPVLDPQKGGKAGNLWIQEAIYGHRISGSQAACYVLLEALNLCAARPLGEVTPAGTAHEDLTWQVPTQKKLRYLLFVDTAMERIAASNIRPDERWREWQAAASRAYAPGSGSDPGKIDPADGPFAYLDAPFAGDFDDLVRALRIARSMEIDRQSTRAHFARFLAVTGPDLTLYDFAGSKGDRYETKHGFFARGGELVYLMLLRSGLAAGVGEELRARLFDRDDAMNRLVVALSDPAEDHPDGERYEPKTMSIGYLPVAAHPAYARMGEDWRALLRVPKLPKEHLFDPLMRMTGLNMMRYFAERSAETDGHGHIEPFPLDMTDGARRPLSRHCRDALLRHQRAADDAVRAHVDGALAGHGGWQAALASGNVEGARDAISDLFSHHPKGGTSLSPTRQKDSLVAEALGRSHNNVARYIPRIGKDIGLVTARPVTGTWLAPTDAMLRALVLANVSGSEELGDFAARLHRRYGIVIGPAQARAEYDDLPLDAAHFEANFAAFEARMTALGLTRRLSDDCAFVLNPFGETDADDR